MRKILALLALIPALAWGQQSVKVYTTDTVQSGCVLNAANATCQVTLAGKTSAGFLVTAVSSPTGIVLTTESSRDGTNWDRHLFADVGTGECVSAIQNASIAVGFGKTLVLGAGDRYVRVKAAAWTSGSATVVVNATDTIPPPLCPSGPDAGWVSSGLSTATTLTLLTGPQSCTAAFAPWACCTAANTGAGCTVYLTSLTGSTSVASTTTTDQQVVVKYGTGSACGTGTTYVTGALVPANGGFVWSAGRSGVIKIPAGNNVCWIAAATGSKIVTATYFVGE